MEQMVRECAPMSDDREEAPGFDREAGIARLLSGPAQTPRAANAGGSGTGDGPADPILALIEAHRATWDCLNEVVIWEDEDAPENAETKAVYDAASDAERKAFQALFGGQPATLGGLQAMLRYLAETPALNDEAEDFRRVMKAVASAAEGIRVGAVRWMPDLVLSAPSTALPLPSSEEAKAAFRAACADADRLMQAPRAGYPALKHPDGFSTWTKHSLQLALDAGEVVPAEYARLYRLAAERELRMDAAALASDIGALHALAYADEYPSPAEGGGNPGGTGEVAGQHVDWHNPPPGFMASPAIEPFGFLRIYEGIETELQRLSGIAWAEYERRTLSLPRDLSDDARREAERKVRERLFIPALTAAVDIHSDGALALAALERRDAGQRQDPVFALIAEHKRAWTEYRRVFDIWNEMPGGSPDFAVAEAAVDEPRRLMREAFRALLDGRPVTSAGALALADYLPDAIRPRDFEPEEADDGEGIRSLAEALRTIATIRDPKAAQGPVSQHDLSGCDLHQLANLHESLMTIVDHVSVTVEALAFWESRASQKLNPAGLVIEAQHDRLSRLLSAVEREAKARQPTNDEERQDRLALLIRHELLCEGRIADKALLAEAVAAWGDR